ncbi:MAG: hypothetical protein AAF632_14275 [Bacteroidota bacterium]
MLDQELQELWQEAPSDMQVKFNQSKLMIDINHDIRKFERTLLWRDVGEIVAAMAVMITFGRILFYESVIVAQVGSGVITFGALLVIYRLLAVKRFRKQPSLNYSFKNYLEQRYQHLYKEKRLLDTILYWYILPILVGYAILGSALLYIPHWGAWVFYVFYLVLGIGVGWFIWWLNRRAVTKQFNPILERIETALKSLE